MDDRLSKQFALLLELDKLKSVLRRTRIKPAGGRYENSAEHSWHVCMMAILLQEHANEAVDVAKVIKMLLVHDIVEIDAGDVIVYNTAVAAEQHQKELAAADRLFGMLPDDQADELKTVWLEFEQAQSAEAKFAKALDRLLPMFLNSHNEGQSWRENDVKREQVLSVNRRIEQGSSVLWEKAQEIIQDASNKGWLKG
ncbi:HD domain-containing protein [Vibrio sp. S4M6]|uniref:HD domain-containing protein n=1 Tax=Vibrio sinus TaxID=2946865 RepID=UPI002029C43C|nr:HD domain-containing protein [Vibrio sinus]MCL9781163.1 HD domain-containing protein [Vibrio sinus]